MRYNYSTALSDGEGRILLLRDGSKWSLPSFDTDRFHPWQEVHKEHEHLQQILGTNVVTLRLVCVDWEESAGRAIHLYARSIRDRDWRPPSRSSWFTAEQACDLPLRDPDPRPVLKSWHAWATSQPPCQPLPWSHSDWYEEALGWADASLRARGCEPVGEYQQITSRPRGTVFRIGTTDGEVFLKGVSSVFRHEPPLAMWLWRKHPERSAEVIDESSERGLYLSACAGRVTLADLADRNVWLSAIRAFSRLQLSTVTQLAEITALGVHASSVPDYGSHLQRLLETDLQLSDSQIDRLKTQIPTIQGVVSELGGDGIPMGLEHGDLSPWQIMVDGTDVRFLDWSDSTIGHPFFSLVGFLGMLESLRESGSLEVISVLDPSLEDDLVAAYLEPWEAYGSMDRLRASLRAATRLHPLHCALKFSRFLSCGLDPEWDFSGGIEMHRGELISG